MTQVYRSRGHDVDTVSFYDSRDTGSNEVWPTDFGLTPGMIDLLKVQEVAAPDMRVWHAMAAAADSFERLAATVARLKPQLLQFEEPVFWPLVRRLKEEGHLNGVLVAHSSYNFETHAWNLRGVLGETVSRSALRDLKDFEQEIAQSCDLVFTVSEDDAAQFRKIGAQHVYVAENGVSRLKSSEFEPIETYPPPDIPYALFVSSAHPPNARGFIELAEGCRKRRLGDGQILICGKVGAMIRAAPNLQHTIWALDRSRILGWVDDGLLEALYARSYVVILPKTHGGGSNLKTAEALASGRPIVATSSAFIGFERFRDLPGIDITDDPDTFWSLINDRLSRPRVDDFRSPGMMAGLLWSECLQPMVRAAEAATRQARDERTADAFLK